MSKNKDDFLGMSFGKASHRLKKQIMFSLVQETSKDICFKCGLKIETALELSVEHKLPWENVSVDLFWDLDNIAFSYLKCNRPHTNSSHKLKKIGPDGMAWCYKCQEWLPKDMFWSDSSKWAGLTKMCKVHHNAFRKDRRRRQRDIS